MTRHPMGGEILTFQAGVFFILHCETTPQQTKLAMDNLCHPDDPCAAIPCGLISLVNRSFIPAAVLGPILGTAGYLKPITRKFLT